ncbi:hypothetical protein SLEP1_g2502 [Rubroshorea leprosula]|uniref:(+)-neomenthol dehydrogenase-like n=1 Tax=Rubroshorea leprosula TaxID=152421 RepID=A0AAV5HNY8_9ROSI|nr:hypothetical protein SLEP1_g2502 [Rubroshorea leprosula]
MKPRPEFLFQQFHLIMAQLTQKYAIVTGANKGIELEICRQLACKGIMVVLTARDEKRGLEAVEKLKQSGLSDHVIFHQLDLTDPASIAALADFVKTKFGRLDRLVKIAGIAGAVIDDEALKASSISATEKDVVKVWNRVTTQTYDLAEECVKTNYFGAKTTTEALIPMLQLSDSPRIVNIASSRSMLKYLPGEELKEAFRNVDTLTEEKLDEMMTEFLKDFKEGALEIKGWPFHLPAYTVSKVVLITYTRLLAKRHPGCCFNSVCPGFVKTDINRNAGTLTVENSNCSNKEISVNRSSKLAETGGAEHGQGHGAEDFRTKVWSMSGGPYCRPKHWHRNTAVAMFGVFLICIPIAMKSAELEV